MECALSDRPGLRDWQDVKRVGVLMQENPSDPSIIHMALFVLATSPLNEVTGPPLCVQCDFSTFGLYREKARREFGNQKHYFSVQGEPVWEFSFTIPEYISDDAYELLSHPDLRLLPPRKRDTGLRLIEVSRNDWSEEIIFWPTVLLLMNARNIAYVDNPAPTKRDVRIAREMWVEPERVVFRTCRLHLDRIASRAGSRIGGDAAIRSHFVMGHFKARKTGVFWWSPFVRGRKDVGEVVKTYEVVP
jgi:hypothetical protein